MVNYQLGKIYKITGNGKTYVGSTTRPLLSQRLAKHRNDYKQYLNGKYHYVSSFECFSDPDCKIELLELCPCSCYDELVKYEAKWIRELECVNKIIPGRTIAEYYNDNKDKISEYQKQYREANLDDYNQYQKQYYEANCDALKEKARNNWLAKKDAINERRRLKRQLLKQQNSNNELN